MVHVVVVRRMDIRHALCDQKLAAMGLERRSSTISLQRRSGIRRAVAVDRGAGRVNTLAKDGTDDGAQAVQTRLHRVVHILGAKSMIILVRMMLT